MTKTRIVRLLQSALEAAERGDEIVLDRCLLELEDRRADAIRTDNENRLWGEARKVPGGYHYMGVCSDQLCFYLRDGGELRFVICEADDADGTPSDMRMHIDFYDGKLPPGITGPAKRTGEPDVK